MFAAGDLFQGIGNPKWRSFFLSKTFSILKCDDIWCITDLICVSLAYVTVYYQETKFSEVAMHCTNTATVVFLCHSHTSCWWQIRNELQSQGCFLLSHPSKRKEKKRKKSYKTQSSYIQLCPIKVFLSNSSWIWSCPLLLSCFLFVCLFNWFQWVLLQAPACGVSEEISGCTKLWWAAKACVEQQAALGVMLLRLLQRGGGKQSPKARQLLIFISSYS